MLSKLAGSAAGAQTRRGVGVKSQAFVASRAAAACCSCGGTAAATVQRMQRVLLSQEAATEWNSRVARLGRGLSWAKLQEAAAYEAHLLQRRQLPHLGRDRAADGRVAVDDDRAAGKCAVAHAGERGAQRHLGRPRPEPCADEHTEENQLCHVDIYSGKAA